jgi:hypothetical protein
MMDTRFWTLGVAVVPPRCVREPSEEAREVLDDMKDVPLVNFAAPDDSVRTTSQGALRQVAL